MTRINDPLFTAAEATTRAADLVEAFSRNPDVLSPDEQALAMEVLRLRCECEELCERIRHAAERESEA